MRAVLSAMAWQEIRAKRQAVRDARTLPARLAALWPAPWRRASRSP
jgi:hypothetical protein